MLYIAVVTLFFWSLGNGSLLLETLKSHWFIEKDICDFDFRVASMYNIWNQSPGCTVNVLMYVCIRTNDTRHNFEPIFMKYTRLVQVPPRLKPIVFIWNWPNWSTDMGENVPQNWFFRLNSDNIAFWGRNFKVVFIIPFTAKKWHSFISSDGPFSQKWSCLPKLIFRRNLGK